MLEPTALLGLWRLRRRLVDRAAAPSAHAGRWGRVDGLLELAERDGEVHWSERGLLSWGGDRFRVTRELRVRRVGDVDEPGWLVCFEDGRAFHPWCPGEPVVHECGEDTYRGLIDVDDTWTGLRVLWDVAGPDKQQRLYTRCTRVLTAVEAAALARRR